MGESPLPKLIVSREEAKEKILVRITEGQRLLNSLPNHSVPAKWQNKCEKWSLYNEALLIKLFGDSLEDRHYRRFYSYEDFNALSEGIIYNPRHIMARSISSLEGICERLDLYSETSNPSNTTPPAFGNDVFIVHGRDDGAKETVARFVEHLGIKPIILHEQTSRGETIIEKMERCSDDVGFAIVLITPDDVGGLEGEADDERNPRPRQNVVFELGYFMGKLGRERVCPLFKGKVENPSDIDGIVYIDMDAHGAWRETLRREISAVIKEIPDE